MAESVVDPILSSSAGDKYIGLALAISSSLAIGTSFIITKKGLISAADRHDGLSSDSYSYLKNGLWWAGMVTMISGEVANFAAYTFAPPILVTPLGALSVLIGAVLASFFLDERLGRIGISGCSLCLVGSVIIILHAPEDKVVSTVDEVLEYALQPGFMFYCFAVAVFAFYMIFAVAPKQGNKNPLVYISICSLVGSVSVMAVKGFGVALKLTFAGNNQLWRAGTWVFAFTVVGCIAVQMNYFNKALDLFPTNTVNPLYFSLFSSSTIIASVILFQGMEATSTTDFIMLMCGLYVMGLGVYLLNVSRPETGANRHSLLDAGVGPRFSTSNRLSLSSDDDLSRSHPARHSRDSTGAARRSINMYRGAAAAMGGAGVTEPLFEYPEEEDERRDHVALDRFVREGEEDEEEEDDEDKRNEWKSVVRDAGAPDRSHN